MYSRFFVSFVYFVIKFPFSDTLQKFLLTSQYCYGTESQFMLYFHQNLDEVKQVKSIYKLGIFAIQIICCVIMLSACGDVTSIIEEPNQANECDEEMESSSLMHSDELVQLAIPTEDIHAFNCIDVTSINTRVLLNPASWDTSFIVPSYSWEDRVYFRLENIALMLEQTNAQFSVSEPLWNIGAVRFYRGVSNNAHMGGWLSEHDDEFTVHTVQVNVETPFGDADTLAWSISALLVGESKYFALEDLADFLGFSVETETDDTIVINTHEANISEYGHMVATEFLSQRLTLFQWDEATFEMVEPRFFSGWGGDEGIYLYPHRFILYDLTGNGIPVILIRYDVPPMAMRRRYDIYMYINGGYTPVGELSGWNELYRDSSGRIFVAEGGHHDGLVRMRLLHFTDTGIEWETIIDAPWERDYWNNDDIDEFYNLWRYWSVFSPFIIGQPQETLTSVRPLITLHEYVSASITSRLADE